MDLPLAGETRERSDAAANRRRILKAARELLNDEGPSAMTMDALAARAGVGKGTIFRRFGDRAGLTGALLEEEMRNFQEAFLRGEAPLGPGAPAADRFEAFVLGLVRLYADHLALAIASETPPGTDRPPVYGALVLHASILVEEIDPGLDGKVTAAMILGAIGPSAIQTALTAPELGLETVERSARALVRGVTTGAARKPTGP